MFLDASNRYQILSIWESCCSTYRFFIYVLSPNICHSFYSFPFSFCLVSLILEYSFGMMSRGTGMQSGTQSQTINSGTSQEIAHRDWGSFSNPWANARKSFYLAQLLAAKATEAAEPWIGCEEEGREERSRAERQPNTHPTAWETD